MRYYSTRKVDRAVYVFCRIIKTRVTRIDMRVAVFADRARGKAGMDSVGRGETVARSASRGRQSIAPFRRFIRSAGECCAVTVGIGALQGRFVIDRVHPAGLGERAELDYPRLYAGRVVLGASEMVECDRAEPVVALAADVGHVESAMFWVGRRLVGIGSAVGRRHMTGSAVLQSGRKTAPVTERAGCCPRSSSNTVQVRAVATVAGVEARGAGLAVEIPRGIKRVERSNCAK